jgi:membrane protease YdiL (CAAX protease family)
LCVHWAAVLFSLITILLYRSQRFNAYWRPYFSYDIAAIALSLMWSFDTLPLNGLGLDPKSPAGMAMEKATDVLILLFAAFVLCRIFGISLGSFYLQRGNLKVALIFGILGFAVMASFGIFQARSLGISIQKIRTWTPWLLMFCLANGFVEELIARGLFLKSFEPFLGRWLSNLVTAVVFSIAHVGVTYSTDLLQFLVVLFVFALLAGLLMQKSDALWGSALFHAGADILIMIGIFAGVKT